MTFSTFKVPLSPAQIHQATSEKDVIRPRNIRKDWSKLTNEDTSWAILDPFYSNVEPQKITTVLNHALKTRFGRRVVANRRVSTGSVFDCDKVAAWLKGFVTIDALEKRERMAPCFGVAIIRTLNLKDPFEVPTEHALNWLLYYNQESKAEIYFVTPAGPDSLEIKLLIAKLERNQTVISLMI